MVASLKSILIVGILLILSRGFYDYLTNFESHGCEMTYMFQMPEYLNVPLDKKVKEKFPRYGLYLYGEGSYARRSKELKLEGIPVLFIPGNAGSHKQARSLGSVAMKKSEDAKSEFHLNYFTVDLNEELSGLFGGVLQEQTEFVHRCIKKILTLYKTSRHPPRSVVLVGHSMGGMIARALFTLKGFDSKLVHTIITQSTPHQNPVVSLDWHLADFYHRVNSYWQKHINTSVSSVTVLATGGGYRDIQVRHGLTSVNGIVKSERAVNGLTMSVPLAWVSADHLSAVWCKQIVLATTRSLNDMIASSTGQISENPKFRTDVFRHHFQQHSGPKAFRAHWPASVKLETNVKWDIRHMASWRYLRDSVKVNKYLAVPIQLKNNQSLIIISNLKSHDWIVACRATGKSPNLKCEEGVSLSKKSQMIPPLYSGKKMVKMETSELFTFTHVIIIVPKTSDHVDVLAEVVDNNQRNLAYRAPPPHHFFMNYPQSLSLATDVIHVSANKSLFYNISLPQLETVNQAFTAHLHTIQCKKEKTGNYAGMLMKLHVPWNHESTYKFVRLGENGSLSLKLQTSKPTGFQGNAELHLLLHPSCTYRLAIQTALMETVGQFLRNYAVYLPTFVVIQVLMVLSGQLYHFHKHGFCPSYVDAHNQYAQPFKVVPVVSIMRMLFRLNDLPSMYPNLGIPADDIDYLEKLGLWALPIPLFLYFSAFAITKVHVVIVHLAVVIKGSAMGFICGRCCSDRVAGMCQWLQLPVLCAAVYASLFHCASLSILMLYAVCGVRVLYLYNKARKSEKKGKGDPLGDENSVANQKTGDITVTNERSEYNFHFSMVILMMCVSVLSGPSLVVWIKNLRYSLSLSVDPFKVTSLILWVNYLIFTNTKKIPTIDNGMYDIASWMLYFCCLVMIPYSMVSLYRVPYFICGTFIMLSIIQLLGFMFGPSAVDLTKKTN